MKKILSICISVIVAVCLLPFSAFAEMINVSGAYVTYEKPGVAYMDYDLRGASSVPEGVTPGSNSYTTGEPGLYFGKANTHDTTTTFGTATVPSDITEFSVEARYTALYNGSPIFKFLGYTLEKTGNYNKDKTFTLKKGSVTLGTYTWIYTSTSDYVDGAVLVKINFNGSKISVTVNGRKIISDVTDTEISKTGAVSIRSKWTSKWTIGSVRIASSATNVTKSNFLMDKTFSAVDTTASLSADDYSISGVDEYITDKGIVRTTKDGTLSAYYTGAVFSGAYTLEVVAAKDQNKGTVYFNRADSSNHYSVSTKSGNSSTGTLWIQKTVDGVASSLLTDDEGAVVESLPTGMGTNDELKYTISLESLDTGDMRIIVTLTNYANKVKTYTVTDKKTDTNIPFTSGKIGYSQSYAGTENNRIESFKVYPTPVEGSEVAKYTGSFNVDGADVAELSKGNTFFTFPVAMIGQKPDFIAALYEDYEMTDVKIFDVYDMNEGIVNLFDTSDSTADNISISLFVWNELEGLVSVLDTYVLE